MVRLSSGQKLRFTMYVKLVEINGGAWRERITVNMTVGCEDVDAVKVQETGKCSAAIGSTNSVVSNLQMARE